MDKVETRFAPLLPTSHEAVERACEFSGPYISCIMRNLLAERDAALVDAKRYRYLRSDAYECVVPLGMKLNGKRTAWCMHLLPGDTFDAAIDHAIDAALSATGET